MRFLGSRSQAQRSSYKSGFTLVELLVVIGIIALLISILMPSLQAARQSATAIKSLSNLRQLGLGLQLYKNDNRGYYPPMSVETDFPKPRWADLIFPYMRFPEIYRSPNMDDTERDRLLQAFAHTLDQTTGAVIPGTTEYFGGYGYNYQYLGSGRTVVVAGVPTYQVFVANDTMIRASSETIAIADTNGSRNNTPNFTKTGNYVVDPPLGSLELGAKGSRRTTTHTSYYPGGSDVMMDQYRSFPAERNKGKKVAIVFCDGHADLWTLDQMDNKQPDGTRNNRYWNGLNDPNRH